LAEEAGERDTRYPIVTVDDVLAMQPEIILLPDEPFEFQSKHAELFKQLFADTPAVADHNILLVDGSLITWHGTQLGKALTTLPSLILS
jgi:ABC-type hemin transport system substrate-binding protein